MILTTPKPLAFAFFFLLLHPFTTCKSLGCDDFTCLPPNIAATQCVLGNVTMNELGVSNTSVSYNGQNLTWTQGQMVAKSPGVALITVNQSFYLGLPPPRSQATKISGCALFLSAASLSLKPEQGIPGRACDQALGQSCVQDLLSQVNSFTTSGRSINCTTIAAKLANAAPDTCTVGKVGNSWGDIEARGSASEVLISSYFSMNLTCSIDFTQALVDPVEQSECIPTTGKNFEVFDVASITHSLDTLDWAKQITPILTIFSAGIASKVQTDLTCVMVVDAPKFNNPGAANHKIAAGAVRRELAWVSTALVSLTVIFTVYF
jgi:hypothetical protein